MKRIGLIAVVALVFLVAAWAQEPLRDVQRNTSRGGGSSDVNVVNFPQDPDGLLYVAPLPLYRVQDILDESVTLIHPDWWYSDEVDVGRFTEITLQVSSVPVGHVVRCEVQYAIADGEPFFGMPNNFVVLSSNIEEVTLRNLLVAIQGPRARVRCRDDDNPPLPDNPMVTDLKLLMVRD